MKLIRSRRGRAGLTVAAGAMALVALLASPAAASPLFCGLGRGPTAAVAIQSAFWDAQSSAQAEGFFGDCTIVGEPEVFEVVGDPAFGNFFSASLQLSCLP